MCLCVSLLVFGVFAASQVTFTISSTISYTVSDVFVDIETRVYSAHMKFDSTAEIKETASDIMAMGEDTYAVLKTLQAQGMVNHVQLFYENGATEYADDNMDYLYKFTSQDASSTPEPLDNLALTYRTESTTGANDAIYSYIIAVKITNLSDIPVYTYIDKASVNYLEPINSYVHTYDSYKTIENSQSAPVYLLMGIGLADVKQSIPENTSFNFPIVVTKDTTNLPAPPTTLTLNSGASVNAGETANVSIVAEVIDGETYTYGGISAVISNVDASKEIIKLTEKDKPCA